MCMTVCVLQGKHVPGIEGAVKIGKPKRYRYNTHYSIWSTPTKVVLLSSVQAIHEPKGRFQQSVGPYQMMSQLYSASMNGKSHHITRFLSYAKLYRLQHIQ